MCVCVHMCVCEKERTHAQLYICIFMNIFVIGYNIYSTQKKVRHLYGGSLYIQMLSSPFPKCEMLGANN